MKPPAATWHSVIARVARARLTLPPRPDPTKAHLVFSSRFSFIFSPPAPVPSDLSLRHTHTGFSLRTKIEALPTLSL